MMGLPMYALFLLLLFLVLDVIMDFSEMVISVNLTLLMWIPVLLKPPKMNVPLVILIHVLKQPQLIVPNFCIKTQRANDASKEPFQVAKNWSSTTLTNAMNVCPISTFLEPSVCPTPWPIAKHTIHQPMSVPLVILPMGISGTPPVKDVSFWIWWDVSNYPLPPIVNVPLVPKDLRKLVMIVPSPNPMRIVLL
jgi:hypothetical protein